ncbi:unnamed protein product [Caenorhabditis sp. 36 PRJEB53466]|nr:unnamed protein product [Caenorhabditis sp. 36 PRJEB53466]
MLNTSLASKIGELTAELTTAYQTSKTFEDENLELLEQLKAIKQEASRPVTLESLEENFYRKKFEECSQQLEQMENKWTEEKNNFAAFKKKTSASMKELRAELSGYRRTAPHSGDQGPCLAPRGSSDPSMSSRSRASSITSDDRVTSNSREEEVSSAAGEEAKRQEEQRKLARRTEKCEFLEEHVRQCLEELQKKTKIIQHFALREEASLLMPSEGSLDKLFATCEFVQVPIVRKSSAYALMGAMFTGGEKKQTQILTEVNSRLQAVLEDVIQKNICMRSSVDTLTADNTRLSRENRLLSLSQVRTQDQ